MECIRSNDSPPPGLHWQFVSTVSGIGPFCQADAIAIRSLVQRIEECKEGADSQPFTRSGWIKELFVWTQEQIADSGLRLSGEFRQLNASPTFSLIQFDANGESVWFKATGEPNRTELSVTAALSELLPDFVPKVLAVHSAWNGWLSKHASGNNLADGSSVLDWIKAAESLASMQILTIGRTPKLLAAGSRDLRTSTLLPLIAPFIEQMTELMCAQTKEHPAPLSAPELEFLASALADSCLQLIESNIPETLGHMDLNPWNILVSPSGCRFLDWAEGCVSCPLLSIEYLLSHFRQRQETDDNKVKRIREAYSRPWIAHASHAQFATATFHAPLVAVYAYALAGDYWKSHDNRNNRVRAGVLRSLTRRMHAEARRMAPAKTECERVTSAPDSRAFPPGIRPTGERCGL
jgi:hypothetical protein